MKQVAPSFSPSALRPILWGVSLDTKPPTYQIVFRGKDPRDAWLARVPLEANATTKDEAMDAAYRAFARLTPEDIDQLAREAVPVNEAELPRDTKDDDTF